MQKALSIMATQLLCVCLGSAATTVGHLHCEYLADPIGIDVVQPRLSWIIESGGQTAEDRGQKQTAYQDLTVLKDAAELLGKADESRQFEEQARAVRDAFNRKFFSADKNQYDRNSQTANAMPLVLGLVPEEHRAAVLDGLVAEIRAGGNRVTAGDVGFHYLVRALSEGGQGDVLCDMLTRADGPGYAYQLKKGATSLTEAWDTNPGSSQNHCMLGHIEEWFYRGLGGIACDPSGPGFKKIVVKPQIAGDLGGAQVTYESPYGRIDSAWKREGGVLTMNVTIPQNTTATVNVPAKDAASVTEGGRAASQAPCVKFLRLENGTAVYAVGSGTYQFAAAEKALVINREMRTIAGWSVHVHAACLATNAAATARALELLKAQLDEIVRKVPPPAVAELRKVQLWVSPEYPGFVPRAEYHPNGSWLRQHGRDPAMAKGVEFTNVRIFEAETRRMPNFALHELAHAYQDRCLPHGNADAEIKAAYECAKAGGTYDKVKRRDAEGREHVGRAYAMTNPQEYFAETTEAFFSRNDFFPFTRDELKQHDPEMFALLARLWGAETVAGH